MRAFRWLRKRRCRIQILGQPEHQVIIDADILAGNHRRPVVSDSPTVRDVAESRIQSLCRAVVAIQAYSDSDLQMPSSPGLAFQGVYQARAETNPPVLFCDHKVLYLRYRGAAEARVFGDPHQRSITDDLALKLGQQHDARSFLMLRPVPVPLLAPGVPRGPAACGGLKRQVTALQLSEQHAHGYSLGQSATNTNQFHQADQAAG